MTHRNNSIAHIVRCARFLFTTDALTIKAAAHTAPPGKLILIVPKKIGSAPVRNRIRRRLRELFRTSSIGQQYHLVIFVKRPFDDISYTQLKELFQHLEQKLTIRSETTAQ